MLSRPSSRAQRLLISLGCTLLILGAAAAFLAGAKPKQTLAARTSQLERLGPIHDGVVVVQEFRSPGEVLSQLSLGLDSYGSVSRGSVQVELAKKVRGKWKVMRTLHVTIAQLVDGSEQVFKLRPALRVKPRQWLKIAVRADGGETDGIAWWVSKDARTRRPHLFVNDQARSGRASFALVYGPKRGVRAWFSRLWTQVAPFESALVNLLFVLSGLSTLFVLTHAVLWPGRHGKALVMA